MIYGYVRHTLRMMRECCEQVAAVVCDQNLPALKTSLEQAVDLVIGSCDTDSASAYWREGLNVYGAERLALYDEVILLDDHVMGPICSPDEMFQRISRDPAAFWGLSGSRKEDGTIWIWPHFLIVKGEVLAHWHTNAGHAWKTFCDELVGLWNAQPDGVKLFWEEDWRKTELLGTPANLMPNQSCPFFARDTFVHGFDELSQFSLATQGETLMNYLDHCTTYDTELIWEYVLRTCHMADICRNLGLYRIVPGNRRISNGGDTRCSVALILHLHYEECFLSCFKYACSMPEDSDIFLTTTTEEKKEKLQQLFSRRKWRNLEVRLIENRGRDVSALLVGCRDLFNRYDVLCFAHDKKSHAGEPKLVGESFAEHCFLNVLGSSDYVENLLALFRTEPRLGLLCPLPPFHANHANLIGHEWTNNYPGAKRLAEQLGFTVPIAEHVPPVAPFGTLFWFRTKALKGLVDHGWNYSDFPEEPNGVDGTILHALERLYPYAAQQEGYYCALIAEETYARSYTMDLVHMLRRSRERYENDRLLYLFAMRVKKRLKARLSEKSWNFLKKLILRR